SVDSDWRRTLRFGRPCKSCSGLAVSRRLSYIAPCTARRAVATASTRCRLSTTMNKRLSTISCCLSLSLLSLSAISYLPLARGQATDSGQTRRPRMTEPLEKYSGMPPAYIYRLETGPRMISQFGPFTSFQVNVDANGNNILGDAANEPSISVDPTDGNKMAIGWRQFDSVQSDFRQAGYGFTTDDGTN